MPAFSDEMRGSEGEAVVVFHHGGATERAGTVLSWNDASGYADVRYADGEIERLHFSRIHFVRGEDETT